MKILRALILVLFILVAPGAVLAATAATWQTTLGNNWATPSLINGTNQGIIVSASSTIGNGTSVGGLTVSGQSTTTGIAYFANNVGIGTSSPARYVASSNVILDITSQTGGTTGILSHSNGQEQSWLNNAGVGMYFDVSGAATAANNFIEFRTQRASSSYSPTTLLSDLYLTANGSVGIGSITPLTSLDVVSTTTALAAIGTQPVLTMGLPTNSGVSFPQAATFAVGTYTNHTPTAPASRLDLSLKTTSNTNVIGDNTVMTWLANGNTGIGTTSPTTLLSIAGSSGIFASTTATSTFFGGGINLVTSSGNTGCFAINGTCISAGGGSSASSTLLSDNNTFSGNDIFSNLLTLSSSFIANASSTVVGNFTSTGTILGNTVNSTAGMTVGNSFTVTTGGATISRNSSGSTDLTLNQAATNGDILDLKGNGSVLEDVFDNKGNFGLGTTSPAALFDISDNTSNGTTTAFLISSSTASATTTLFSITNSGQLITGGPSPTCGTGCSSVMGDEQTIYVTSNTLVNNMVINFPVAWPESPACTANSTAGTAIAIGASSTVSTLTLTPGSQATFKAIVHCQVSSNFTF